MAWLCVDKDGEEFVYSSKPKRTEFEFWVKETWLLGSIGDAVKLPKGTIKKIIGRELTWEDEPIEI